MKLSMDQTTATAKKSKKSDKKKKKLRRVKNNSEVKFLKDEEQLDIEDLWSKNNDASRSKLSYLLFNNLALIMKIIGKNSIFIKYQFL